MKVILLEDVKSLGKKGQLVEVNAGYARNFILPKKLGIEATSKNINDLKLQKAHEDKVAAEQLAAAKVLAEELKNKSVELKMKISVDEPIKSLGVHNVKIKLHPKVTADLKVKVTEK